MKSYSIRHSPIRPIHLSHTKVESTRKSPCCLEESAARVNLPSRTSDYGSLDVGISCSESDWQVSSLEQVCTSSLPSMPWLGPLHPFTAVKNLYLSNEFAPRVAPALQELVEPGTTEGFPTQNLFVEELQPSVFGTCPGKPSGSSLTRGRSPVTPYPLPTGKEIGKVDSR